VDTSPHHPAAVLRLPRRTRKQSHN
jgi:hypothetical protein